MAFDSPYNPVVTPLSIWFIGLPCSGKTTVSKGVSDRLKAAGYLHKLLDGDDLRKGINNNLGFSIPDRNENIRRVAEINKLFLEEGYMVLNALICPLEEMRTVIGSVVGKHRMVEIFVDAPLKVCEARDVKGMYKKAKAGEIQNFTGINSPFEPPVACSCLINTDKMDIASCVDTVFNYIQQKLSNIE